MQTLNNTYWNTLNIAGAMEAGKSVVFFNIEDDYKYVDRGK